MARVLTAAVVICTFVGPVYAQEELSIVCGMTHYTALNFEAQSPKPEDTSIVELGHNVGGWITKHQGSYDLRFVTTSDPGLVGVWIELESKITQRTKVGSWLGKREILDEGQFRFEVKLPVGVSEDLDSDGKKVWLILAYKCWSLPESTKEKS